MNTPRTVTADTVIIGLCTAATFVGLAVWIALWWRAR